MRRVMGMPRGARMGLVAAEMTMLAVSVLQPPAAAASGPRVAAPGSTVFGKSHSGMQNHPVHHHTLCTGADFRYTSQPGSNHSGAELAGADFTGANLAGSTSADADFSHACFIEAYLAGASFKGCDLTGADFTDANLIGANLAGSDLTGADFTDAVLDGIDLAGTNIEGTIGLNKS